jgi:hypothetical protein
MIHSEHTTDESHQNPTATITVNGITVLRSQQVTATFHPRGHDAQGVPIDWYTPVRDGSDMFCDVDIQNVQTELPLDKVLRRLRNSDAISVKIDGDVINTIQLYETRIKEFVEIEHEQSTVNLTIEGKVAHTDVKE